MSGIHSWRDEMESGHDGACPLSESSEGGLAVAAGDEADHSGGEHEGGGCGAGFGDGGGGEWWAVAVTGREVCGSR
jgi:hypothetical protein